MASDARTPAHQQPQARDLVIGGYEPFSTVDWPNHLVATLFLQGCPWQCTYCHNPSLQDNRAPFPNSTTVGEDPPPAATVPWEQVLSHLHTRIGRLDGVVFSGGEPTRQLALVPAMQAVREMGFGVGLHTAGAYPSRLEAVLPETDWVGLDIKATANRYAAITGIAASGERAWRCLDLALEWGGALEVRITVDPTVHTRADVMHTIAELAARGVTQPVIQEARAIGATDDYAQSLGERRLLDVVSRDDIAELTVR